MTCCGLSWINNQTRKQEGVEVVWLSFGLTICLQGVRSFDTLTRNIVYDLPILTEREYCDNDFGVAGND